MNPDLLSRYAPSLINGFGVTILCWGVGGALGLLLGFAITIMNRLKFAPLNWLLRAFVEIFRGTPFLMQLFLIYAGGPSIGLRLSATSAGILGLGLYSSAYFAEIFRAGFASVPAGQIEAATSVGMTPFDTLIRVALPGALIAAVPSIVNMLIVLSKETVVLSIITVPELMYQVQTMAAETFTAFDAIFAMAVFYWLLVETVSRLGARLEARVTAFLAREESAT
jgi:polar amino acid transport system permease protein